MKIYKKYLTICTRKFVNKTNESVACVCYVCVMGVCMYARMCVCVWGGVCVIHKIDRND